MSFAIFVPNNIINELIDHKPEKPTDTWELISSLSFLLSKHPPRDKILNQF
jgi:hypothetical protein